MNIRYIALHMDYDSGNDESFRVDFNLKTRFISNFLSQGVRKLKLETDGTFNMISVVPCLEEKDFCRIVGNKALQAKVLFDKQKYLEYNETSKYEYCLQLLEQGYKICAKHREVPLKQLLKLHQIFKDYNFKNEWTHKKKKFKEYGIEAILDCSFTTDDFKLHLKINDIVNKKELASGVVIRTLPDEVHFAKLFKDIILKEEYLIITEYQNRPKFKILLSDLMKGILNFEILDIGLKYIPLKL